MNNRIATICLIALLFQAPTPARADVKGILWKCAKILAWVVPTGLTGMFVLATDDDDGFGVEVVPRSSFKRHKPSDFMTDSAFREAADLAGVEDSAIQSASESLAPKNDGKTEKDISANRRAFYLDVMDLGGTEEDALKAALGVRTEESRCFYVLLAHEHRHSMSEALRASRDVTTSDGRPFYLGIVEQGHSADEAYRVSKLITTSDGRAKFLERLREIESVDEALRETG